MIVADASAIGRFLLPDEDRAERDFAIEVCATEALHVPPHWGVELASLVRKAQRRGRVSAKEAQRIGDDATRLVGSVTIETETTPAQLIATALALELSAYDASYLLLAQRLNAPLLAFDGGLRRAALAQGVKVLAP